MTPDEAREAGWLIRPARCGVVAQRGEWKCFAPDMGALLRRLADKPVLRPPGNRRRPFAAVLDSEGNEGV